MRQLLSNKLYTKWTPTLCVRSFLINDGPGISGSKSAIKYEN
jgi:hypothetical protein